MILLISYILLALVVSFLCSVLEATLLTVSPVSIERAKQNKVKWAPRMELLKKDIDRPLSAILTLNTVAHTMGAAGAGAEYARLYGNVYEAVFAGA
jgi:Mg2+/Co2+ transporter CorB